MSFTVSTGDCFQVRWYFQNAALNQVAICATPYQVFSATPSATVTDVDLIAMFQGTFPSLWKPCLSVLATYFGVALQKLDGNGHALSVPTTSRTGTGAGTGGAGGGELPSQVSCLLQKKTAVPGRKGHGRIYVPFPSSLGQTANGQVNSTLLGSLGNLAVALALTRTITPGSASATINPVLIHIATPSDPGPPPIPATAFRATPLTDIVASDLFATQRRRGDYGRQNTAPF